MDGASPNFIYEPHPEHPGWHSWRLRDDTLFNAQVMGEMLVRTESGKCRLRMFPARKHQNLLGMIHGAVTLGLIDISMFAALRTLSSGDAGGSVTLELSTQFIGAGQPDRPLDAVVEILRETRRLLFVRGEVIQGDNLVAGFTGIVRKASEK